jgi:non-heme chloroperoxidase
MLAPAHRVALICIKGIRSVLPRSVIPVNLTRVRESSGAGTKDTRDPASALVLWSQRDGLISPANLKTMAAAMPDCRLVVVPGIGYSMNLELPAL